MLTHAIANDCSYTYANIVFSTQSVALACVLFAARVFELPFLFIESTADAETSDQEYSSLVRN